MVDSPLVSDYLDFLKSLYAGLGHWLSLRFKKIGSSEDLRKAVNATEMALNLTPPDSPNWPGYMDGFGQHLGTQ